MRFQSHDLRNGNGFSYLISPDVSGCANFQNNENVPESFGRKPIVSIEDKHETIVATHVDKSLPKSSGSCDTREGQNSEGERCDSYVMISEIEDIDDGIAATSVSYADSRSELVTGRLSTPAVASQMVLPKQTVKNLPRISSSVAQNFPEYFSDSLLTSSLLSVSGPSSFSHPLHFYSPPPCSD